MKTIVAITLTAGLLFMTSHNVFPQSGDQMHEFGINIGGYTNFPANQHYLTENINVIYVTPYIRVGQHEFSAGLEIPLTTQGLFFNDNNISPRLGAIAGYKFYIFNVFGRENMFIHYSFQYLRFKGEFEKTPNQNTQPGQITETDMYINNVIGLGYNLFFDTEERFGLFYTLDYIISQTAYRLSSSGTGSSSWTTSYVWNNVSTNFGLIFKITSLKKKVKK